MNKYTIYCTSQQTRKAILLGVQIYPTSFNNCGIHQLWDSENRYYYDIPTTEQLIEWLEEQDFRFEIKFTTIYCIMIYINNIYIGSSICANSRKAATLTAIDTALEYLSNKFK